MNPVIVNDSILLYRMEFFVPAACSLFGAPHGK
jgi:hypothetical protein